MVFGSSQEETSSDLDAGKCVVLDMPEVIKKISPPPYNYLLLFNNDATSILKVVIDGGIANDELVGGKTTLFCQPNSWLKIEKVDQIIFNYVAIENTHATHNISAGDIKWTMKNF